MPPTMGTGPMGMPPTNGHGSNGNASDGCSTCIHHRMVVCQRLAMPPADPGMAVTDPNDPATCMASHTAPPMGMPPTGMYPPPYMGAPVRLECLRTGMYPPPMGAPGAAGMPPYGYVSTTNGCNLECGWYAWYGYAPSMVHLMRTGMPGRGASIHGCSWCGWNAWYGCTTHGCSWWGWYAWYGSSIHGCVLVRLVCQVRVLHDMAGILVRLVCTPALKMLGKISRKFARV